MPTILLIDDNEPFLANLTEYFENEGFRVLAAEDGMAGVLMANQFGPDIIICDIVMPEMDGYGVLNSIVSTPRTFDIPFIFSTCSSENEEREAALRLGADDYIVKPFDLNVLLDMANAWLRSGSHRAWYSEITPPTAA